jgi:hypothetical protein
MLSLENIEFAKCPIAGHYKQPLSLVCIDSKCTKKTLICYTCSTQIHKGHNTIPLGQFLSEIQNKRYANN